MFNKNKRYLKNILLSLWIGILFFSASTNAFAEMLKIEDVSTEFNRSKIVEIINFLGLNVVSSVNTDNKTIDFSVSYMTYEDGEKQEEKKFTFTYTNEYIEYNNRDLILTDENYKDHTIVIVLIEGIAEAVTTLSGYENKTLSEGDYTNTYDEYGFQIETTEFQASDDDEPETYAKYFKVSLDTEKIDKLINKYGQDDSETEESKLASMTNPTLTIKEITENSVRLSPRANYYGDGDGTDLTCYIYRSEEENGTYERIPGMENVSIGCGDESVEASTTDDNLKSNTTYYYKVLVRGGTKFSEPYVVTTKTNTDDSDTSIEDDNNNDNKDNNNNSNIENTNPDDDSNNSGNTDENGNVTENPHTADTWYNRVITLVLSGSLVLLLYNKNKLSNYNKD